MYKTLSEVWPRPKKYTLISGNQTAEKRPKLAALVGGLFAQSVDIEQAKAGILIHLLQGEPLAGMEMFMSLRSAQASALNAVVQSKLPGQAKIFDSVLKVVKKFDDHRNKFAHWVWAYSEELPNHVCLEDPRFSARYNVLIVEKIGPTMMASGPKADAFHSALAEWQDKRRDKTIVYDEQALVDVGIQGDEAYDLLIKFFYAVIARSAEERAEGFLQLGSLLQQAGASDPSARQHD